MFARAFSEFGRLDGLRELGVLTVVEGVGLGEEKPEPLALAPGLRLEDAFDGLGEENSGFLLLELAGGFFEEALGDENSGFLPEGLLDEPGDENSGFLLDELAGGLGDENSGFLLLDDPGLRELAGGLGDENSGLRLEELAGGFLLDELEEGGFRELLEELLGGLRLEELLEEGFRLEELEPDFELEDGLANELGAATPKASATQSNIPNFGNRAMSESFR